MPTNFDDLQDDLPWESAPVKPNEPPPVPDGYVGPHRKWAQKLMTRHANGEALTLTQIDLAQRALGLKR